MVRKRLNQDVSFTFTYNLKEKHLQKYVFNTIGGKIVSEKKV